MTAQWIDVAAAAKADTLEEAHRENDTADEYLLRLHRAGLTELLQAILERPAWMERAECRSTDQRAFFLEKGTGSPFHTYDTAKGLCAVCEVRADCLAYANRYNVTHGMWGGLPAGKVTSAGRDAV